MRCIAILTLSIMPVSALAADVWQTAGDWTILINTEDTGKCFASRELDDGSEVQIGAEPTLDGGYFAIYNEAWTHVEEGQDGTVEFDFGSARFGGEAIGKIENGMHGGYAFFNNPAFIQEFARSQTVKIIGSQGNAFELDLTGTSKAIRGVLACQDALPEPEPEAESEAEPDAESE
ncbi:MAG: hypothetical protein ABJX32_03905 [Tateyamaria sp.]|uniref:hypothetical protein n=1 Tax=Tateyamaria sp. TaxID=1929288 RepID=UPI00329B2939